MAQFGSLQTSMVSGLEKLRKFAIFFYGVSLLFKKKLKIYLYFNICKLKVTLKKYRTAKRTHTNKNKSLHLPTTHYM